MSTPPVYVPRYTRADRRRWRGDRQFIDGVAIAMTPGPFVPHERVVPRLSRRIGSRIESACGRLLD